MNINQNATVAAGEVASTVSTQTLVRSTTPHSPENKQESQTAVKSSEKGLRVEDAVEMAETLNETMSDLGTHLGFYIREDKNNQVVVEIKNKTTNELVRQIPSEELLQIMDKMEELSGLIFDEMT